jgi:hypothetical protein
VKRFGFTFDDEGGFAGATRAVEDQRLRDAVMLGWLRQFSTNENLFSVEKNREEGIAFVRKKQKTKTNTDAGNKTNDAFGRRNRP